MERRPRTHTHLFSNSYTHTRLFSRSTERTIRLLCPRPPILFLTAFLSLIRYSTLLNEAFVSSFLSSWRSYLQPFALPSTIHARIRLPFLWESIYPIFFNFPPLLPATGTRNACPSFLTTCLSSATSFYSASRISNVIIHPSAKLLRES